MSRVMKKVAMAVAIVGWTSIAALAQQSTTSQSKAFEVISVNEEYGLIRSLGLKPTSQALAENKGHSYDVITVIDPQTNKESQLYFNIDKPFKWQAKP